MNTPKIIEYLFDINPLIVGKNFSLSHHKQYYGYMTLSRQHLGFTLAELLIALAILGVIAMFTIPKILISQRDARFNAIAKETAGMVSESYVNYKLNNTSGSGTGWAELTPVLNYVRIDTISNIDDRNTQGSRPCNTGSGQCLVLHNGAYLLLFTTHDFDGTAVTNALNFVLDPDGKDSGTTDGPGKSVQMFLYYNGRVGSRGTTLDNTVAGGTTYATPNTTLDPAWFSW